MDPISLGVLAAPPSYGADIVCGDLQPLGIHMNYGGGQSGFMATRDEEKFCLLYTSHIQSALQQMVLAGAALVSDSGLQMVADQSAQLGDRIQI